MNKILFTSILFFVLGVHPSSAQQHPNVLLILVDDLNTWIGALDGHPNVKTPNIDRLASRGVLFANAHCQAPICGPSRASMLSGLLPSTTGIYGQINDQNLRKENPVMEKAVFLPDFFEQHGYKTMGVGKIYHNGDRAGTYDEYGGFASFGPKPEKRFKYDPAWYDKPGGTQTDWGAYPEKEADMPDYKIADWAVQQLQKEHDKPFLLTAGFMRPHVPWYTTQEWFDLFDGERIYLPPYKHDDFEDIPLQARRIMDVPMMPTTEWLIEQGEFTNVTLAYLACVAFVDHQIGKVLDALEASAYAENTLVVLASDHGYHLGEKNRYAKHSLWERATHVPMIMAGPGVQDSVTCDAAVGLIDIFPTLIEYCGLPPIETHEGHSLFPLLSEPDKNWKYPALTTYGRNNHSVYLDNWHYIRYDDGSEELYGLDSDPNEWKNLAQSPRFKKIKNRLARHLPKVNAEEAAGSSNNVNKYFRGER